MAETTQNQNLTQLDTGTYEIIRKRLDGHSEELRNQLNQLNDARKEVFGSIETQLIANDRINTSNYCIAKDIIAIGDQCIFGYNVHIGLRSGISLQDVFSIYEFQNNTFQHSSLELLANEKFSGDFQNLYRYYKDAFFSRFVRQGTYLYMVFQISKNAGDFKAFKWLVKDGQLIYIDARSEHEIKHPVQYEFRWSRVQREMQRTGKHPHVSVLDRVFVETVGGDLTIKVEDNTDDGLGIYREEVEYKDQSLDDAEYMFANLGNLIALKIRPYQEGFRYFVYNEKIQQVRRVDALEQSGVLLPEGHGLIFANGYYLQTGEMKIFEQEEMGAQFERRIVSPNGEDYLYVFYNRDKGAYVLLLYNVIAQEVETPIYCNGFTLFENGELCYFKSEREPTKHHSIQIWQTPFIKGDILPSQHQDNYLYKVGNKDIVKVMSECYEILTLIKKEDTYEDLYLDIEKKCMATIDSYYWLDRPEAFDIAAPLKKIKKSATSAIDEYEKKISLKAATAAQVESVASKATGLFKDIAYESFDNVADFVGSLSRIRSLKGEMISLKDLRYADLDTIVRLEEEANQHTDRLSNACISFLLEENALLPYQTKITEQRALLESAGTARHTEEVEEATNQIGIELQLLIEVVSNLKIEDATQKTSIIDGISELFGELNQFKAGIKRKKNALRSEEGASEFNSQLQLLDQGIINFLDMADSPSKCDEYLTKMMVQLEELEGRFAEFDAFIEKLGEKREEVYASFENRRVQLIEARNNRTAALQRTAERIIAGMRNRMARFENVNEINGFFAADLMAEKVRDIIAQLNELEDNNKANVLQTSLKSLKEEALRQLRDKADLYAEGENVIKLGEHIFDVNVQPLDLTIVNRDGDLYYHLTGTDFYEQIEDERLNTTTTVWNQDFISESKDVYRAEFLAYELYQKIKDAPPVDDLVKFVKEEAATRYEEGYVKGVHDVDAAIILEAVRKIDEKIGLLRFDPDVRAYAQLVWKKHLPEAEKESLIRQIKSARQILEVFPDTKEFDYLIRDIKSKLDII